MKQPFLIKKSAPRCSKMLSHTTSKPRNVKISHNLAKQPSIDFFQRPIGECRDAGSEIYRSIIKMIGNGRDAYCIELGNRWFCISGGKTMLESLYVGAGYAAYVKETEKLVLGCKGQDTILGEALRVIDRDVPRTVPPAWHHKKTKHILATAFVNDKISQEQSEWTNFQKSLKQVLTAFVLRNRLLGYCQGLNSLAAILLAVMEEEKAFCVLCVICETLRPKDYYASGSNAMGGFHIDTAIAVRLIKRACKRLAAALGTNFILIVNMSMFHYIVTIFVTA